MAKKGFLDGYKTYDTGNGHGNVKKWKQSFHQRMNQDEARQIMSEQNESPHTILGVSPHASADEIKKSFRKLITEWHPDRNQHRAQEAEEQSKKIIAAYTLLSF